MPFQSKEQSKACFATGGFGGKVDCKKFADMTDYSHLPKKKKQPASETDRPKLGDYKRKPK
jgi:hypothetical protein